MRKLLTLMIVFMMFTSVDLMAKGGKKGNSKKGPGINQKGKHGNKKCDKKDSRDKKDKDKKGNRSGGGDDTNPGGGGNLNGFDNPGKGGGNK